MPKYRVKRHSVTQPLDKPYRLIPLTQGQNAIADLADFERLSQFNWYAWWNPSTETFYAQRTTDKRTVVFMHQELLPGCQEIDHRNKNSLDNRRENLRPCTRAQNTYNHGRNCNNTSGFKGVTHSKSRKKWVAQISKNRKGIFLGHFESAEEAARAYDVAAKELFGEFAHVNFPQIP